jgi:hypothetical protein
MYGELVMSDVLEIQSAMRSSFSAVKVEQGTRWGQYEPFVDEHVVADFLGIKPRRVLEMARRRLLPAHPIGGCRKIWRFRISEIDAHFILRNEKQGPATIALAVPVTRERKHSG